MRIVLAAALALGACTSYTPVPKTALPAGLPEGFEHWSESEYRCSDAITIVSYTDEGRSGAVAVTEFRYHGAPAGYQVSATQIDTLPDGRFVILVSGQMHLKNKAGRWVSLDNDPLTSNDAIRAQIDRQLAETFEGQHEMLGQCMMLNVLGITAPPVRYERP